MQNKEPNDLETYPTSEVPKTFGIMTSVVMIILGLLVAITGWYIFPVMAGMLCYYTQQAETAVGSLLMLVGALLLFTKTSEAKLLGSGIGVGLGTVTILIPTYIIGMCSMSSESTEPALILLGAATIIVSAAGIIKYLPKSAK